MNKKRTKTIKALITAGPTAEPIDPVRYISNYSTGTMGYEIAREAKRRKWKVYLVSGPVSIKPPRGIFLKKVMTAGEMKKEIARRLPGADCLIMAAAVADFRPAKKKISKIKKKGTFPLLLMRNPDILRSVGRRRGLVKVGFALETNNLVKNAMKKISEKKLDLIVANLKAGKKDPFGPGKKDFVVIDNCGKITVLKNITKPGVAREILDRVERMKR